jgi:hypothetical protein
MIVNSKDANCMPPSKEELALKGCAASGRGGRFCSSHVVAIEVVGVSSSGKTAGRERVLGLGGVVHADYNTAAAAQVQDCLRSAA